MNKYRDSSEMAIFTEEGRSILLMAIHILAIGSRIRNQVGVLSVGSMAIDTNDSIHLFQVTNSCRSDIEREVDESEWRIGRRTIQERYEKWTRNV